MSYIQNKLYEDDELVENLMNFNYSEKDLVRYILKTIFEVMSDEKSEVSISEIELHNVVYNVAEDQEIDEITRGWYKKGPFIPAIEKIIREEDWLEVRE